MGRSTSLLAHEGHILVCPRRGRWSNQIADSWLSVLVRRGGVSWAARPVVALDPQARGRHLAIQLGVCTSDGAQIKMGRLVLVADSSLGHARLTRLLRHKHRSVEIFLGALHQGAEVVR